MGYVPDEWPPEEGLKYMGIVSTKRVVKVNILTNSGICGKLLSTWWGSSLRFYYKYKMNILEYLLIYIDIKRS